jgi:protein-disulfide isomerase
VFALANAGIHIDSRLLSDAVGSPVTLGILVGYVVGKPIGVVSAVWLGSRLTRIQPALSWPAVAGAGTVAGIGFTVALLVSTLAFEGRTLEEAKLGVLAAALVASALSWVVFAVVRRMPAEVRARQVSRTADDLLDLSEDVDPERDHVRGPEDAPVTLLEYGDYECPYCGEAEVAIRQLLDSFGDELRYVWRHLPLNDVHPNAQMAAEAAEAAGAQGRFWDMHDRLLDGDTKLSPAGVTRIAEELGLDVDRVIAEVRGREHEPRVAEDVASADSSGVAGTPTFFVNGRRHSGAYDVDTLSRAVREARRRALARREPAPAAG